MGCAIREGDGYERADDGQTSGGQLLVKPLRVGRQVTPITQFRAGVAGGRDLVQHLGVWGIEGGVIAAHDAPGAGRVADAECDHSRILVSDAGSYNTV